MTTAIRPFRSHVAHAIVAVLVASLAACSDDRGSPAETRGAVLPIRFTEIAHSVGLDLQPTIRDDSLDHISESTGGGVAWIDFDNDGDWDVYAINGPDQPNALFRNDEGVFTDVGESAGVDHMGWGMGVAAADYDGDGWTDLFVTNFGAQDILYRNTGQGSFEDVTASAAVGGDEAMWSTSAAWGDVDGDGDLDLYVARYIDFMDPNAAGTTAADYRDEAITLVPDPYRPQPNVLYRNLGDGTFADVTDEANAADAPAPGSGGKGLGVAMADVDGDGDLDVFIANDVTPNTLLRNDGSGRFENVSFAAGVDDSRNSMGVDFGDFDSDGDLDLFCTNWQNQTNAFYRNNHARTDGVRSSETFDDVTLELGLGHTSLGRTGWGAQMADFDNDGHLDLYIANGYTSPSSEVPTVCIAQPDQVFRGDGARFTVVEGALAFSDWGAGRGTAIADYDDDGDADILVSQNQGRLLLFRNDNGSAGGWVKIRAPVGSALEARVGSRTQALYTPGGSSFLSTSAPETIIGLPSATERVDHIVMRLPDGTTAEVRNVPTRSRVVFGRDGSVNVR